MKFHVVGITEKKERAMNCNASLVFKELDKEDYNSNEPPQTSRFHISPYARVLTGLGIKSITNSEILNIIKFTVSTDTGHPWEKIATKSRKRDVTEPRQMFHYFMKKYSSLSLAAIGSYTLRDHATVLNSVKVISDLIETNPAKREFIKVIDEKLDQMISHKNVPSPNSDTIRNWNKIKHKYINYEE